ncbi:heavy metal-associated isoprenylated plant protein 7-like [Hibiscus syriacus]|uniref:heavy metal-associated isoprenylated plant protein 7-like n=1 Tax=Hibiscus syriacus TaxID=106335 RepID=UPI0019220B9B|nr:heavy metal-associated isoprenylated plant protein 7-like [Hibiscus syriacus]
MGEEEKHKPVEGKEVEEEEKKGEESKQEPAPVVVAQEIILKVLMHCEGCARKVRRCLVGFQGVEDVMTDCKSNKVVMKGDKADPLKVLDRLQRKSHRKVELISPIPEPPAPAEETKAEDKENSKPEDKKEEPPAAVTVVLKVYMHCEACALGIKKRIEGMKGVESAEPDLNSSEVTVKGVFEPPKLVEYVHKRTGKKAVIVKQEAEAPKTDGEEKAKDDSKEEKKSEESGGDKDKKEGGGGEEEDNINKDKKQEGDGHGDSKEANAAMSTDPAPAAEGATEETKVAVEMKKNEYYYYPPRYATEFQAYPPQIFSDENPNACSVM